MHVWLEQTSAIVHFSHAPPCSPHVALSVPVAQVSPSQQPRHVLGPQGSLQTPDVHFDVGEQISHAFAAVPHASAASPFSHLSSRQQPVQFAGVHVTTAGLPSGPSGAWASSPPKPRTMQSAVAGSATFSPTTRAITSCAHVVNFA